MDAVAQYGEWADPAQLGDLVTRIEAEIHTAQGAQPIELPMIFFAVLDVAGQIGMVHLPYSGADIARLGGAEPRTRIGRMLVVLAANMLRLPPAKLREDMSELYREGERLLFAGMAADAYSYQGGDPVPFTEVTDFAQLPPEQRQDVRDLVVCDGRGNAWKTRRVLSLDGPVELEHMVCLPDLDRPPMMAYDPQSPWPRADGRVPWALAAMAIAYRDVFVDKVAVKRG